MRWRALLADLGLLIVGTVIHPLGRPRHGLLVTRGRAIVAIAIVPAAVLIDLRIVAVDVAIDNLVVRGRTIVPSRLRIGPAIVVRSVSRPVSRPIYRPRPAGRVVGPPVVRIVSRRVAGPAVVSIVSRRVARPAVVSVVSRCVAGAPVVAEIPAIDSIVVGLDVVVIDVPMDGVVAIDVVHVHGAIHDVSVHVDVVVAVVDVDVV